MKMRRCASYLLISYYRLSGYWYPFRERDAQGLIGNHFIDGSRFDQAIALYEFDKKLRSLILDALERVEVAVRTQITYHMGPDKWAITVN